MGFVAALRCGGSRELHRVGYGKPMSSLLKTLCRWYSTVRGLMKSWAAISGLDRPSPGEPGDLGLSGGELGRGISRACAYALAGGMQLARRSYSEPVGSHTREHLVRGAQLFAGIDAPVLASQPFSVEQVGAAERPADAGAAKPVDRLAIEALGCIAVAQHRASAPRFPAPNRCHMRVSTPRVAGGRRQRARVFRWPRPPRSGPPAGHCSGGAACQGSRLGIPRMRRRGSTADRFSRRALTQNATRGTGIMTNNVSAGETSVLSKELRLPNGITLSNRLAQSAMTEHLATGDGAPSWQLIEAYRRFAVSGAALIISGNVMVNGWSLEAPRNVVIEDERHMPQLRQWAATTSGTDARLILQLSLSGRQTQRGLALAGRRQDVATASAVPLTIGGPLFKPPRALTDPEIRQIIAQFTSAARIAAEAGFAGVQIHAAHGYLLSQFLSPLVNQRTDQWGGSVQNRMRMLIEVLRAVKSLTPEAFLLTVKMNVSDFQSGGFDADDALIVAQALENEGVHLIEFSGGTYESSAMIDGGPARDQSGAPEPYFLAYAQRFARELTVPVMLSGGFRSRTAMIDAVESGAADVIGLARPIAVEPDFPRRILDGTTQVSLAKPQKVGNKNIDDLLSGAWYQEQIARLGRGKPTLPSRKPVVALAIMLATMLRDRLIVRIPRLASRART
jgi:2,4-dienoyl-CoA reductase-like NADH-dependent reductase (Old Yellow Enzyme family)